MELVQPAAQHLASYVHALQQGWSPDNLRPETGLDELTRINEDPERFIKPDVFGGAEGLRFRILLA